MRFRSQTLPERQIVASSHLRSRQNRAVITPAEAVRPAACLRKITTYQLFPTRSACLEIEEPPNGSNREFRVGDKESKREDDSLDAFCYGDCHCTRRQQGFLKATVAPTPK